MNEVQMIVLWKGNRKLFINKLPVHISNDLNSKDHAFLWLAKDILAKVGPVQTYPIFYLHRYTRRWPELTKIYELQPYAWIYKGQQAQLVLDIILAHRGVMSDDLIMDKVFNLYTAWVHDQEIDKMTNLL